MSVPNENFAFIHCCYHAIEKSKLNIGPIFLNDLLQFKNIIECDEVLEDAKKANCKKEVSLGICILRYLKDLDISNEKQVEDAIEIIICCHNMPEFLPRRRLDFLSSVKDSYNHNSFAFSLVLI